ncbi:MAG: hypothetical protein GU359_06330 [Desulfurococcales archaeon]|nr:hypothetical protein [Desulfurococcales archaeon]MCC6061714.1 hypothetical protein [Desulfurococcales archaeon]MCI4456896.1 hypothetical protein [Desulfurococcaceae archaeon]NAZ13749.1 hypothetical protein [Desulfurococcales archaeon]
MIERSCIEASEETRIKEKILMYIRKSDEGLTYDELRDLLEREGVYIDGVCLRKIISDMIRERIIIKELSDKKRNKFVYKLTPYDLLYY